MNAARILADAGYDSAELRDALGPVDPERVNVWPASQTIRRLWRTGVSAVTQGRLVLVDPELLGDRHELARIVVHELVHVRQFAEVGYLRFMFRYLGTYARGRLSGLPPEGAYLAIPVETEARRVTARVTGVPGRVG